MCVWVCAYVYMYVFECVYVSSGFRIDNLRGCLTPCSVKVYNIEDLFFVFYFGTLR